MELTAVSAGSEEKAPAALSVDAQTAMSYLLKRKWARRGKDMFGGFSPCDYKNEIQI